MVTDWKEVAEVTDRAMGTEESSVSGSIYLQRRQVMSGKSAVLKRWLKRLVVAVVILAVGSILGTLLNPFAPGEIQSAEVVAVKEEAARRGVDASAAPYAALAEQYAAASMSALRSFDARAARYYGKMAEFYAAESASALRGMDAAGARYAGLAEFYAAESGDLSAAMDASAARYTATAKYCAAQSEGVEAWAARYTALAESCGAAGK
jgi:hypothetical protein